jgi:nickel/cobalt transporter (NicO) family protein
VKAALASLSRSALGTSLALFALNASALAQTNPFGPRAPGGAMAEPASGIAAWFLQQQAAFHKALTMSIGAVATDPAALWGLIGLAFAYGVLHAIGPGHGKAVIASYLVANESAMKRGIALAFGAALTQALVALGVVALVAGLMGGTAATMNRTVDLVEKAGFAIILTMGLWITFRKARALFSSSEASTCAPDCGHDHSGDPRALVMASTRELVLTAIGAGIRPCSGAIILLVFALTKGLFLAGALSVGAMALGTALGTSLFALLAVKAKVLALNVLSGRSSFRRIGLAIELLAGLALAAFGLALLMGAMSGGS